MDWFLLCSGDNTVQTAIDNPNGFEVGSKVEVPVQGVPRYGVIRWIGRLPQVKNMLLAGLELVRRVISVFLKHH